MAAGDFQLALSLLFFVTSLQVVSGKGADKVCENGDGRLRDSNGTLTCSSWLDCCGRRDTATFLFGTEQSKPHCCVSSDYKWYIIGGVGGLVVLFAIGSCIRNKCGCFDQFKGHRHRNMGGGFRGIGGGGGGGNRNLGLAMAATAMQNNSTSSTSSQPAQGTLLAYPAAGAGIPPPQGPHMQQAAYPVASPGQAAPYPGQQQQQQQMAYPGQAPDYGVPQAGYPGNPAAFPPVQGGLPQCAPGMQPSDPYPMKPGQEPNPNTPGTVPGQAPYPNTAEGPPSYDQALTY